MPINENYYTKNIIIDIIFINEIITSTEFHLWFVKKVPFSVLQKGFSVGITLNKKHQKNIILKCSNSF